MMLTWVYIVDDDALLRRGLQRIFREAGYSTRTFTSNAAFLQARAGLLPGCIIVDIARAGMDGLELQRELTAIGGRWPMIVLTRHPARLRRLGAPQCGSLVFLGKPRRDAELFAAVLKGEAHLSGTAQERKDPQLAHVLTLLPARETEVLQGMMAQELTKQTAARLGISESSVKTYRARIKKRLGAASTSQVVQLAVLAGMRVKSRP